MEIRDLISKIDSIQVEAAYQSPTGHNPAGYDEPYSFAQTKKIDLNTPSKSLKSTTSSNEILVNKTIQNLKNILSKVKNIANLNIQTESIKTTLLHDFKYLYEEGEPSIWQNIKDFSKRAGSKLVLPLTIAYDVWNGWNQINEIPEEYTKDQKREEITRIVSKLIASWGPFWVGTIIGGAIAGAIAGPAALPGFIAGAVGGGVASYYLGDDVDAIVDAIVDHLYDIESEETYADSNELIDPSLYVASEPEKFNRLKQFLNIKTTSDAIDHEVQKAIINFQKTNNIPINGFPTSETYLAAGINESVNESLRRLLTLIDGYNNVSEGAFKGRFQRGMISPKKLPLKKEMIATNPAQFGAKKVEQLPKTTAKPPETPEAPKTTAKPPEQLSTPTKSGVAGKILKTGAVGITGAAGIRHVLTPDETTTTDQTKTKDTGIRPTPDTGAKPTSDTGAKPTSDTRTSAKPTSQQVDPKLISVADEAKLALQKAASINDARVRNAMEELDMYLASISEKVPGLNWKAASWL